MITITGSKKSRERKLTRIFTPSPSSDEPARARFRRLFQRAAFALYRNSEEDIKKVGDLTVLADSPVAGVYLAASRDRRRVFVFGHGEYDRDTLRREYERDLLKRRSRAHAAKLLQRRRSAIFRAAYVAGARSSCLQTGLTITSIRLRRTISTRLNKLTEAYYEKDQNRVYARSVDRRLQSA
ncbi:MAG: homoserine O-acetyltransferase/O-succinyltransferase family protein [Christensenellales bacterium]